MDDDLFHSTVLQPANAGAVIAMECRGMTTPYTPELGQMVFGQPSKDFECSALLEAALESVRHELRRVLWNAKQVDWDPFQDSEAFRCDVFGVWAYEWSDDHQPYNFKHPGSGVEVSWYKYLGRGMSVNKDVPPDLVNRILEECLAAVRELDCDEFGDFKKTDGYLLGGNREVPYFENVDRTDASPPATSA